MESQTAQVKSCSELEAHIKELESVLATQEQSWSDAECVAEEHAKTVRERLESQVYSYKEQSGQYAITIATMEDRLFTLMQTQQSLQIENETLNKQLLNKSQHTKAEKKKVAEETRIKNLEELVKLLRHQLAVSTEGSEQHQNTIRDLQNKIEEEKIAEDELKIQHIQEVEDMRKTLSSQENMMESQRQEMNQLRDEISEKCIEITSLKEQLKMRENEMTAELKQKLEIIEKEAQERGGELMAVGQRCLGEHHSQVLARQKDIITQLRLRVSDTEDASNPTLDFAAISPDGSHEATLRELHRVREELIDERARRHLEAAGRGRKESDSDSASESDPVVDALQHSEDSYFDLVSSVCEGGFIKSQQPGKRMPVTPLTADRHSVIDERKKFSEKVAKKIKATMKGKDKSPTESDGIDEEGSSEGDMEETVTELRSQLEATSEELQQQKRLNIALVRRKEFIEQQAAKAKRFQKRPKTAAI